MNNFQPNAAILQQITKNAANYYIVFAVNYCIVFAANYCISWRSLLIFLQNLLTEIFKQLSEYQATGQLNLCNQPLIKDNGAIELKNCPLRRPLFLIDLVSPYQNTQDFDSEHMEFLLEYLYNGSMKIEKFKIEDYGRAMNLIAMGETAGVALQELVKNEHDHVSNYNEKDQRQSPKPKNFNNFKNLRNFQRNNNNSNKKGQISQQIKEKIAREARYQEAKKKNKNKKVQKKNKKQVSSASSENSDNDKQLKMVSTIMGRIFKGLLNK